MSDFASMLRDQEEQQIQWKVEPEVLLHPQIPKPMHGLAPRVVLGEEWWDVERRKAYSSTNFHCIACGVHKTKALEHQWLEAHECYETNYYGGRMTYVRTVPLCQYCHNYIHQGRLLMLLDEYKITKLKFDTIIKHGNKILRKHKLKKPEPYAGYCAPWKNWRMVVFNVEYEPLVKSYIEWSKKYNSTHCEDDE